MSDFVVENRMWNPEFEAMPRAELEELQVQRLRETVERASAINFYRERFESCGITADSIRNLDDLRRLPFTTKQDLRDNYPFGFFALPKSELARIHASSGTTGKPTFVGYTKNDLELWSELVARFLTAGGMTEDHVTLTL